MTEKKHRSGITPGSVKCSQCRDAMHVLDVKKYTGKWPWCLVVVGVTCILFIGGIILGIPLLLLGIYMLTAEETISFCPGCGYYYALHAKYAEDD